MTDSGDEGSQTQGSIETLTYREPRLLVLFFIVLIAAGLSALLSIGRQEDPTITNLFASVTTLYPGASNRSGRKFEMLWPMPLEGSLRRLSNRNSIQIIPERIRQSSR